MEKSKSCGESYNKFYMFFTRVANGLSLIIIFISIAQLCNGQQYGYKSLNNIDSKITTEKFKTTIKKRINFSRSINYVNLIFNCIIYFYYNIRISPIKHCKPLIFLSIDFTKTILITIELILNCVIIGKFKSLSYQDDYFINNNDIISTTNNIMSKELFNGIKDNGNKNLGFDATILSFNIFQLILIICALIYGAVSLTYKDEHKLFDCFECLKLFFFSESETKNEEIEDSEEEIIELKEKKKKQDFLYNKNSIDSNIFFIKYYIRTKYNAEISTEHMMNYFINEINLKFIEKIDLKDIKKYVIKYIKDKLVENLKCPITQDLFLNPYITPEGQTFDKTKIEQSIKTIHANPLTKTKLNIKELIPNRKVLDLVEFYKNYSDIFDEKACLVLKSILKKDKDEYYENPVVISSGEKIGTTIEGDYNMKYKNLIVKSLIELLGDILDEYFQSNSNQIQIVNNDMEISDMQNSDVRNINNELN